MHLKPEQLMDYFDNLWLPDQAAAIEAHIARCDECADSARRVFEARYWVDSWSIKNPRGF